MKIQFNSQPPEEELTFDKLADGEIFEIPNEEVESPNDGIYMKLARSDAKTTFNYVQLSNGQLFFCKKSEIVKLLWATLHIK